VTAGPDINHSAAFELLPWLTNGSLAAAEREGVELHVRSCIVCRREIKELERLRSAVRNQPTLHLSAEGGLDRLERELDRESARRPAARDSGYVPFFRFAAVATIGVAFLSALVWLLPGVENRADYATLATQPHEQHAQIDVVFDRDTPAADIQSLLHNVDGEIVAGPTDLGRYGVRIHDGTATDAELDALVATLGRDPRVRFAGRSYSGPTQ
jgi:hypothetical protein